MYALVVYLTYTFLVMSMPNIRMHRLSFREVTDLLCITATELSDLFGLQVQSIRQVRLDPSNPGYRAPPKDWETKLAPLCRERGGELVKIAEELEG